MGIGVWRALTFPLRRFGHFFRALIDFLGPQLLAALVALPALAAILFKGWLIPGLSVLGLASCYAVRSAVGWMAFWIHCIRQAAQDNPALPSPAEARTGDGWKALLICMLFLLPSLGACYLGCYLAMQSLGAAVATTSDRVAPLWVWLGSATVVGTFTIVFFLVLLAGTLLSLASLRLATSNRLLSALNLPGLWRDLRQGGPDFFLYLLLVMIPGAGLCLGGLLLGSANLLLLPLIWILALPLACYTQMVQASILGQYHRAYLARDRAARSLIPKGCLIPLTLFSLMGLAGAFLVSCLLACLMCWVKPELLPSTRPPRLVRYAPALAPDSSQYAEIDAYALKASPADERDLDSLAAYLGRGARTDSQKARAIFRWISDRVAYDVAGLKANRHPPNDPEYALRTRLVVCDGYSNLFMALAQRVGLEAEFLYGAAKSGDDKDPFEGPGHAWNRVKVDGRWALLDCTWGAGHVDTKSETYQPGLEDFYFLTPPEQFVYSHFPENAQWQCLTQAWSKEKFRQAPDLRGRFFGSGLKLTRPLVFEHGVGKLVLEGPEGLKVLAQVGDSEVDRSTLVSRKGRTYTVEVSPTQTGSQWLNVYVGKPGDESLAGALRCPFQAEQSLPPLPQVASTFVEQEVELTSPRQGELPSGQIQHFELRVPGASEAFVSNGEERLALRRVDFDHFVGDLSLKSGEAIVYAHYGNEGYRFQGILDYRVR